ncbi:tetratricopeptide repeat protein [Streptomyces pinistramenti]|uniref:tetratricopeptide repeat protein n=1 Tax=Streptomyces pinistramenti TaxID=2884812 RepID=UPI001D07A696|nr:tetratricopeptide repeat protein [Streptomyces pinistramenti]MCB5909900.1 tetratricopeptide repeat protein [Streptomyces pinistramenti]
MTDQAVGGGHLPPGAAGRPATAADARQVPDGRRDGTAAGRPGRSAATAPPATVVPTRTVPPPFAGRTRELKALRADIARAGLDTLSGRKGARSRVLLIAGRPGSGRTRLAAELLRHLADEYPDGVLRAGLTGPGGAPVPTGRVARGLLTTLGASAPPGACDDELTEALRTALATRRAVLFLDDAPGAEQVEPLLPDAPRCLVLVVSQGPLTGIPDVRPCTLGGLESAAAVAILGGFAGPTRIAVDPRTAEAVAEECGGQPAALVLAGGWLAARPKSSVSDLRKALRAVPIPADLPSGDHPLHRAFHLAYEALAPSTARILRLLTLAPAGLVDAHTASALAGCSVAAAARTLQDVAALGLLHPVPGEPTGTGERSAAEGVAEAALHPQYRLPGCLAPATFALLQEEERPAEIQLARARMLERTVRLLQSCRAMGEPAGSAARHRTAGLPKSLRFPSRQAAADWLRSRRAALLDAARIAVADGELDTLDRRLMAALVRTLMMHEGAQAAAPALYSLHTLVLEVAERRGLGREKAAALLNLADLDGQSGRTQDALARYRGALEAARAVKDPVATGRALESLGGTYSELGDWQRAADWYGRALELRLSRGESADAARLHGRIGGTHTYAGRWGEALKEWRAAAGTYRRLGDVSGQARASGEVARVQEYAGRPEEALRTCLDALHAARSAGDGRLEAALQLRIADTLDRLGDPAAARLHRAVGEQLTQDHPE